MGNFAQEGKFPSPCNGLFALEGLTFSTGYLDDQALGFDSAGLVSLVQVIGMG
jgi:hypothetical protein